MYNLYDQKEIFENTLYILYKYIIENCKIQLEKEKSAHRTKTSFIPCAG